MHSNQHAKRRKKRVLQGTKTVTVVRGKLGYGFTISGQNPCMLSCIVSGSPAEAAGLKPGDLLYFVNGQNVSRACHDDVVRMVGLSTGTLELQVAENVNSSDSSDDDYPPRSKSRYPNRVRPRHAQGERGSKYDKASSRHTDKRESKGNFRHYTPLGAESDLSSSLTSQEDQAWFQNADVAWHRPNSGGIKPRREPDQVVGKRTDSNGFAYSAVQTGPVISTAKKITSAAAVVKKVPPVIDFTKQPQQEKNIKLQRETSKPTLSSRIHPDNASSHFVRKPEISPLSVPHDEEREDGDEEDDGDDNEDLPVVAESVKAVVGYIGSIETPSSHTRPHQRLQALRSAVRRLRVEKRVHTLVLMNVNSEGVVLTNAMGKQLALYPSSRIAFSGICPDDERFFGLVTLSMPDDDSSSYMGGGDSAMMPNSSCHIFMIEPELSPHSAHVQQAEAFQISCTTNAQTRRCDEFPRSATSLILCIANLYRDSPPKKFDNEIVQSQALADPVRQAEQINSNSSSNGNNSNSDSGLGFGREEAPLEQNEQVCVVDLPNNRQQFDNSDMSVAMDTSLMSMQQQSSPEVDVVNTSRSLNSTQRPLSAFDIRRGLNYSTSSEECWQQGPPLANKLTPRAMPDPAYPAVVRSKSTESMPPGVSNTENLRQSMQRLLQARHQQLQEQNCMIGSDGESHAGDPVMSLSMSEDGHAVLETGTGGPVVADKDGFAIPTQPPPNSIHHGSATRSAFQVPRPVSAPLSKHRTFSKAETVDMETLGKLSPRAFPHTSPPSSAFRSPSAPPAPFFPHRDSDDDDDDDGDESEDDPYIRQILEQFSRDRRAALDEDSRRFSEGFALSKKREKEKYEVGNVQKWTKAGSFRRNQHMLHKQSFSQSHESLAVGEDQNTTNHKIITACSVNNIACQTSGQDQADKVGRVASWAVNFNKLLRDPVGLSIFTDFLQKEFSEENIIFWKACEQYRQLADDQQRKAQAKDIYSRYLSAKASDPVNVDSAARSYTEKFLDNPTAIMFDLAQQQIFQLMRQDSYARFLKSDLYKNKLMEEMEGKPLETPRQEEKAAGEKDKKKGKGKENDEKRRRSILPWKQSRKSVKSTSDPELKKMGKKGKEGKDEKEPNNNNNLNVSLPNAAIVTNTVTTNSNMGTLKKAPGPGIDLSTMRKEVFHPKESYDAPESHFKFCRIVMPDGSTTVVCAKPGQTSRLVLSKLCEKRSISIASVDVFLLGSDKPLDLNEDISTLGSKEIVIERRVLFRLDLPNGKSIGVKAKPNRSIRDVFKPILNKYGFRMDNIMVHLVGSQECMDLDVAVSELDNQRASVVVDQDAGDLARQGTQPLSSRHSKALTSRSKGTRSGSRGGSLEEITNKIFEDLMRGKSQLAHGFDELGVLELDKAKAHKNEEARSLGLFGLLRKESWGAKDNSKGSKSKGKVTFALPRSDSKKKGSVKEGEKLFEMLSGAQRLRMEEQRGVIVSPCDMPSFLCQDDKEQQKDNAVEEVHADSFDNGFSTGGNMFDDVAEISKAGFMEKFRRRETLDYPITPRLSTSTPRETKKFHTFTTPMSEKWKRHGDASFSQEGVIPSPREAEAYFRMSPVVIDSKHSGITQSLEDPLHGGNNRMLTQSFDDSAHSKPDLGNNKLDANISSHFGSHAFRPVHLSGGQHSKAPVASPEKFSPENKKIRCSPEVKNSVAMTTALPNKMSPITKSSPSSISHLFNNGHGDSPITSTAGHTGLTNIGSSPDTQPGSDTKRMSDAMLAHKLQQARRERDSTSPGEQNVLTSQGPQPVFKKSPKLATNSPHVRRSHDSTHTNNTVYDQQDLAQRALLSPRFDHNSQYRGSPFDSGALSSMDMAQRALLSPRFDESPRYRQTDPPPYQRKAFSPPYPTNNDNQNAILSTRLTGSPTHGNSSISSQKRQITLPFSQPPVVSPRYQSHSGMDTSHSRMDTSPPQFTDPPPYSHHRPAANVQLEEEETVTFV